MLGNCVHVSLNCIETFTRIILLFMLITSGAHSLDDSNSPSEIM